MSPDPTVCYQALLARDARFDGRFFAGVVTTGIFCRPICPAPKPRRKNVRFYTSAAAAADAGFRPCLRCRPEASPGSPGWLGTEAVVHRAMRLIAEGALDSKGMERFADGLGVGSRHLRRLFQRHVGASPISVAKTRRVLFAKKLIDDTDLPMSDVALSAGFASIRRFNAAVRETYARSPTELRALARKRSKPIGGKGLTITLAVRPPFDWGALVGFLGPRAIPGVEAVGRDAYRRTFRVGSSHGVIRVAPVPGRNELSMSVRLGESRGLIDVVERARRLFDLDADPSAIHEHLHADARLRRLVDRSPGLRVPGAWDPAELAVRAVLGQQVTVSGATTLAGRLARAFGEPLAIDAGHGLDVVFPRPADLADADLSRIGLPRARQETVRSVARACCNGSLERIPSSLEELVEGWTGVPGVGAWTAHYIAMRAFREPDAFPASDLGLRKTLSRRGRVPTPRELLEIAEPWRPWRAYAAMHLWNTL